MCINGGGYRMREASLLLQQLYALQGRAILPTQLQSEFERLRFGFQGELIVDEWVDSVDCLKAEDLYIQCKSEMVQLDKVVFIGNHVIVIDAKNFSGNYYVDGSLFVGPRSTMESPIRSRYRTEKILKSILPKVNVVVAIAFVNKKFNLNGPTESEYVYFHHDRMKLIKDLTRIDRDMQLEERNYNQLLSYVVSGDRFQSLYDARYFDVKKGLMCDCRAFVPFEIKERQKYVQCFGCGKRHILRELVKRNIDEWMSIYSRPISFREAVDWCEPAKKSTVHRVLNENYNKTGSRRKHMYECKDFSKLKYIKRKIN